MCARVYGAVHGDTSPKRNGRRGQKQGGVDVFVRSTAGLIAIQSKRYKDGALTLAHIEHEVKLTDESGVPIKRLVIATTASSDARLVPRVLALSAEREALGKFSVEVDFWEEIEAHIKQDPKLLALYDPNAPGGAIHNVEQTIADLRQQLFARFDQGPTSLQANDISLPQSLKSSLDKIVSGNLDAIAELVKQGRYRDADSQIVDCGKSFDAFDAHQKARWYVLRSICRVHVHNGAGAADDLLTAYELYPDDEKIVAAGVRGYLLKGDAAAAAKLGAEALIRFPSSAAIWANTAFAKSEMGDKIADEEVPPELANDPDVLTAMCSVAHQAGENERAWRYGSRIVNHAAAKPTNRSSAFTAALAWAAAEPLSRTIGMIPPPALAALAEAVAIFEPRTTRLWVSQSAATLPADVSNLAYSYYLLGRYNDLIALYDESAALPRRPEQMLGIKLAALNKLQRDDELLKVAREQTDEIDPASVVMVAEVAANAGDLIMVDKMAELAGSLSRGPDTLMIRALRAIALFRSGKIAEATQEALAAAQSDAEPRAALIGIRALLGVRQLSIATDSLNALAPRLATNTDPEVQVLLADTYFYAQQYANAAGIYARFCTPGHFTEHHARLLRSYVKAGMRSQARQLLSSFPAHWIEDELTRDTAIMLAQKAGDWQLLRQVVDEQKIRRPDHVTTWLLALTCERSGGSKERFIEQLSAVPEALQGPIQQLAQLASLQIQFGEATAGLRRFYRLLRSNMHSREAASAYILGITLRGELVQLTAKCEVAGPGTTCTVQAAGNAEMTFSIELDGMADLPPHQAFHAPDSEVAKAIFGKRVGETFEIVGTFSKRRAFRIQRLVPVYLHLMQEVRQLTEQTPEGLPNVQSATVIKEDGTFDMETFMSMVRPRSELAKHVFDTYAKMPVTLGICAEQLDTTSLELIQGWPQDAAPLRMCAGDRAESTKAFELLSGGIEAVAVDLATLADLVSLRCASTLAAVPKVYLSTSAVQILDHLRASAINDRPLGKVGEVNGEIRVITYPDDYRSRQLAFYEQIQRSIDQYCTVCPAYGASSIPTEFVALDGQIGDDEYEALLLAVEKDAVLLSVDLHLRQVAEACLKVKSIWPQAMMCSSFDLI